MPTGQISFVGDRVLTFVNYRDVRDLSYRSEARAHNAQNRASNETPMRVKKTDLQHRRPWRTVAGLQDPLSTYARDPFAHGIASEARALESVWLETFHSNFFLPYMPSDRGCISSPQDAFLAASRSSHMAYQNLILLTAATSRTRLKSQPVQELFAQQAFVMSQFRTLVDAYYAQRYRLSPREFQDVFSAAFSFSSHEFERQPAYNAIVYANFHLISASHNHYLKQLPTVEWIRTLTPRPGLGFNRNRRYLDGMARKNDVLFDFLQEARENAGSEHAREWAWYFAKGTALRLIVTADLDVGSELPWPGFHKVCMNRILFLLHLHLSYQSDDDLSSKTMHDFEQLAKVCVEYEPTVSVRLFLWSLFTRLKAIESGWMLREQILTLPVKELLIIHGTDFSSQLGAWLLQDRDSNGVVILPEIDIDGKRRLMATYYNGLREAASEFEPPVLDWT